MTITVNLSPKTEATLRRWAAEVGDDLTTYVTRVLTCAARNGLNEASPHWPLGVPIEEFHAAIQADRSAYLG